MTTQMFFAALLIILAALTASGCAGNPPVDKERGASVKQMVEAQVLDPEAAANPPELGPQGQDGYTAVTRMEEGVRDGVPMKEGKVTIKRRVWKYDTWK